MSDSFAGFDDQSSKELSVAFQHLAYAAYHNDGFNKAKLGEIRALLASGKPEDLDKLKDYGFQPTQIQTLKDKPRHREVMLGAVTHCERNYDQLFHISTTHVNLPSTSQSTREGYRINADTFYSMADFYDGKGFRGHKYANDVYDDGPQKGQKKYDTSFYDPTKGSTLLLTLRTNNTRYETPAQALDGANQFINILKEGLQPDVAVVGKTPTLTPYELEIVQRILAGEITSMDEIRRRYPNHINLSNASLQKLIDLRSTDPKLARTGIVVVQQLQTNRDLAHLSDDGPGVYGISIADLTLLQSPGGQAKAVGARNGLINALNANKAQLAVSTDNIPTLAPGDTTQPAVPVLPDFQAGTENQGTIVRLTEEQTALVANLRTALNGPPSGGRIGVNADQVNTALSRFPYRVRIQMLREALREAGTPPEQVNGMTERQVRETFRARMLQTNPKAYFELMKEGDVKLLQDDLAELDKVKTDPVVAQFLRDERAYVDQLKAIKEPVKPAVPSNIRTPDEARKIALDMLQTLSDALNRDARRVISNDDLEKFQVLLGDDDTKANDAAKALAAKLGVSEATLIAWRNDPAKKKVGAALFKWMERNQHQDDKLSGIVTGDGDGISGKDLAKFLDAANSATIGDADVQNRAFKVLNNFNVFSSNTLPTLVDRVSTVTPAYTDPGAYIMPGGRPTSYAFNGPGNLNSGILFPDSGGYRGGYGYYGGSSKSAFVLGGSPSTYSYSGGHIGSYNLNSSSGYYANNDKNSFMITSYKSTF